MIVRAPATSANIGAGFDTAAVAFDLWNELEVSDGSGVVIEGEGASELATSLDNLAVLRREDNLAPEVHRAVEAEGDAAVHRVRLLAYQDFPFLHAARQSSVEPSRLAFVVKVKLAQYLADFGIDVKVYRLIRYLSRVEHLPQEKTFPCAGISSQHQDFVLVEGIDDGGQKPVFVYEADFRL